MAPANRNNGAYRERDAATLLAQGAKSPDGDGLTPVIQPSVAYPRDGRGNYPGGHSYGRDQNPTLAPPERLLAQLEDGADALLFASGMAAATTLFEALPDGAPVAAPRYMYWTIRLWLEELAARRRIRLDFYDNRNSDAAAQAAQRCAGGLVWVETPANPFGWITDIAAVSQNARRSGALVAVDNTISTPILTQPLKLGADFVMHSATKQLNGHTDVMAGALLCADETTDIWQRVRFERGYRGTMPGPFDAWLLHRGMRTLHLRVQRSAETAARIAHFLTRQPQIAEVYYAGLPNHPGHAVAADQMHGGFGPMLSFRPVGGKSAALALLQRLQLFRDASSIGGLESLVEHRAAVEGEGTPVPDDLLRLSIGLEAADDLIADLASALGPAA